MSLWASEGSRDFVADPQSNARHENLSKFQLHELTGFVAFLAEINIWIVQNEVNDGPHQRVVISNGLSPNP